MPARGGEQEQAGAEKGTALLGIARVRFLHAGAPAASPSIAPEKAFSPSFFGSEV